MKTYWIHLSYGYETNGELHFKHLKKNDISLNEAINLLNKYIDRALKRKVRSFFYDIGECNDIKERHYDWDYEYSTLIKGELHPSSVKIETD